MDVLTLKTNISVLLNVQCFLFQDSPRVGYKNLNGDLQLVYGDLQKMILSSDILLAKRDRGSKILYRK